MPNWVEMHFPATDGKPGTPVCLGDFEQIIMADSPEEVPTALMRLDQAINDGRKVVGFCAYDAAAGLDAVKQIHTGPVGHPLLWFGVGGTSIAMKEKNDGPGYQFGDWEPAMTSEVYQQAFDRVQNYIREGDTYQINLTFPLRSRFEGDVAALFSELRQAQSAAYAAWIHTDDWDILSASPELFFRIDGKRLLTRPMKGTRPRGMTVDEDLNARNDLASHPKDRAENVMIVDLLRNDMGRLARLGSIEPVELFSIEKYPTVWQMTSTVEGDLEQMPSLSTAFRALFPCGSVTGAPKVRTMAIIRELEQESRGVYCGTIGFADQHSMVFNVAIRTLVLTGRVEGAVSPSCCVRHGQARYDVGSGLVADSDSATEYDECLTKAEVLRRAAIPPFDILETLAWHPQRGFLLLERHLARMARSARYFDFDFSHEYATAVLEEAVLHATCSLRVRLLLSRTGVLRVETYELSSENPVLRVSLSPKRMDSRNCFLYHKTTHRSFYQEALKAAQSQEPDIQDCLLLNEKGELTESTLANIALCVNGKWLTPAITSGLLAGTMREELLAKGELSEAVLTLDHLQAASGLHLFNSVRGRFPVALPTIA